MRISDWSSDVCSSDLTMEEPAGSETLLAKVAGTTTRTSRRNRLLANIALYVVAMALALAVSSVLIVAATEAAPFAVFDAMSEGSLSRQIDKPTCRARECKTGEISGSAAT